VLFSVWDTRVGDFQGFVTETKRSWPASASEQDPFSPATAVSWGDATAFCTWLTDHERKLGKLGPNEIYRLPSDHEWSCAAGIGDREDASQAPEEKSGKITGVFPWGTQWPPPPGAGNFPGEETVGQQLQSVRERIAGYRDDFPAAAPCGSFAPNQYGLFDMGGNVWQWCEDLFRASAVDRVLRGGAFNAASKDSLLSSFRRNSPPTFRADFVGFRVVLAPASPSTAPTAPSSRTVEK
jgi:formylglycine-generating enzyme required for sulfatase activity